MKKLTLYLLVFIAIVAGCEAKGNALEPVGIKKEITLAVKGESGAVIIIPFEASTEEAVAAAELEKYIGRITGAKFRLQKDNESIAGNYISVGNTIQMRQAGFGKVSAELGSEGIAVKVSGGNIYLIGGTNGIMNSVMAFLEEDLGCRWYSDKWELIPENKDGVVKVTDRVSVPDFSLRSIYSAHVLTSSPEWAMHNRVMRWNHFNHMEDWFCHTYSQICPMSEFAAHPEFFAKLPNGEPFSTQLCPTHPEIIKRAKERALASLKTNKRKDVSLISISEYDGSTGHCHCERCEKINTEQHAPIAAHLTLVNEVACAIKKEYPDIKVDFIVYSKDIRTPPSNIKMESNVALWFCTSNSNHVESYRENKAVDEFYKWRKLVDTVYIWEYGCDFSNYFRVLPTLHALTDNIKFWKENNVDGIMFQEVYGTRGGDQQALRAWVLGKMLWDSHLDPNLLSKDFCEGVFNEAAPEMYEYYQLVDKTGSAGKSVEDFYGETEFISRANNVFDRAFSKADKSGNPELHERLDVHYVPIALMEIGSIFRAYPGNKDKFPNQRYGLLLDRIKKITSREEMSKYSEIRSMSGRIAELESLLNAASNGVLGIHAVNATLYEGAFVQKDTLATNGVSVRLPCDGMWYLQWQFPVNLCIPGQKYQLRAQLRVEKDSGVGDIATSGVDFSVTKEKSFAWQIKAEQLSSKEYRWIDIGKPFLPEENNYIWFAANVGSNIGGLFVDRIELIPVKD